MFLKRFTVLCYVTISMFIGVFILLYALNFISFDGVVVFTYTFYHNPDLRMLAGIIGGMILLTNFIFYRYFSVNVHRDKVIAFDNPSGRVSVSLMAMEDLLRRMVLKLNEVKDVRIKMNAAKKGVSVRIRLMLKSEGNIPELTSKVQDRVKRKIQDTIGLEEPVDISIYVGKIIPEKMKNKIVTEDEEQRPPSPTVPFQGYRA